ncbi:protoheme IX farnesyltransferase [Thermaerobacter marianensis DSM 12885]|uniref:Protoheme IX farnesyltransferase n=2 Tax=Thermaerobacter marianensis TaxID=73919 RepID=E6SH38_THEM7|nr:protoheme IX farnesyltransferase [Thermaerobacter marianensis DSM 12885]
MSMNVSSSTGPKHLTAPGKPRASAGERRRRSHHRPGGHRALPAPSPFLVRLRDYVALCKPRIVLLLLVTGFAGWWLGAGAVEAEATSLVAVLLGLALASGSANALNCYVDRDIDAVMRRTANRPLPAGRLTPRQALLFGVMLGAASMAILLWGTNPLTAGLALAGILFYVFVYTVWLKRRSVHNTVIGGIAGALPPLIGWAAATGGLAWPALVLFLLIFFWQPPHFWVLATFRQDDYRRAGIPMLPVVRGPSVTGRQVLGYSAATVAVSLLVYATGVAGPVYLVAALLLGGYFLYLAWRAYGTWRAFRDGGERNARWLFGYSILYLFALFVLVVLDHSP